MGFFDFFKGLFRPKERPIDDSIIEKEFDVVPVVSHIMHEGIALWYQLYINNPPWKTCDVKPLGLPGAIGRELTRHALSEFTVSITGGPRADYLNDVLQSSLIPNLYRSVELGLCLGGIAYRPYIDQRGQLQVDATGATAFTPVDFDGSGRCISGVFREVIQIKHKPYCRLEFHGWEQDETGNYVYVIRNKCFDGETGGGNPIPLATVPQWANLQEEVRINNLEKPLFSYFRNPSSNDIDPSSKVGVSIYGGEPNVELLKQADQQWEEIQWEYESGERKVFNDGPADVEDFGDRLFQRGMYTPDGNLFNVFSPAFRDSNLYAGFQWILQRIEYNCGLSFGTISDPQSVAKTATEILAAKNRQRITVSAIQNELETALDGLLYAMNAYTDLYGLATNGEYEAVYNWGDGVIDDPDTVRQDKALDLQEISAGIMNDWEYRVKWYGETPDEARANLPKMNDLLDGIQQSEIGPTEPIEPIDENGNATNEPLPDEGNE